MKRKPFVTIARKGNKRVRVRADQHPDYSTCPASDGWEHVAIPVYRIDLETPVSPYGWQIPADGPAPHPVAFGEAYVTTGEAWRYCSPELLVTLEFAGDVWPVWTPGVDVPEEVAEWWAEWIMDHSHEIDEHTEPYGRRFRRETAAPIDPATPIRWYHPEEADADREECEWIDPRDGEAPTAAAIRLAIEAVHTGTF